MAQSAAFSSERVFFKYDLICFTIHMNMLIHKLTALLTSILLLSENNLEVIFHVFKIRLSVLVIKLIIYVSTTFILLKLKYLIKKVVLTYILNVLYICIF